MRRRFYSGLEDGRRGHATGRPTPSPCSAPGRHSSHFKARICDTLGWSDFPESSKEFQPYQSLRTHSLEVLLTFTGQQQNVKTNHLVEWSAVAGWDPEVRYKAIGTVAEPEAKLMIDSAATLLGVL